MLIINEQVDLRDGNNIATGIILFWSKLLLYRDDKGSAINAIGTVDETTDKIVLTGIDLTDKIKVGSRITIINSTGNNGDYTVQTIAFNAGNTEIVTNEDITDGTDDGTIVYRDFEYVLEVEVVGFGSLDYANKSDLNAEFGLKLDFEATKPIGKNYKFDITITEYESSNGNDLADAKVKAQLETDGFTNVVII